MKRKESKKCPFCSGAMTANDEYYYGCCRDCEDKGNSVNLIDEKDTNN